MSLTPGTRLGPYEILSALGAGGMGEVYRATDTKLKRQVAIKILPPSLAADRDRLARFQREAEVLASLNHPNIAAIYGLEESEGVIAQVRELVEGDDLSQRIARGAVPLDESLPIAKQIAEALEAAHEQGIIHRDLKPANINVRSDGTAKVLDFGLAKLTQAPGSGLQAPGELSQSPTLTSPAMTQAGMILGTAAYMSPEQAKGRPADKRSDLWAFGCVLFEMATGRRAFDGEDAASVIAGGVIVGTTAWYATRPADPVPPRVSRLLIAPSGTAALTLSGNDPALAITPDGSRVIYVGNRGTQIFVRALDALEPVAVFTGGPHGLFVSPDGQWIGFIDGAAGLKKVAVTGGPPVTLAILDGSFRGATWGPEDTIIVATNNGTTGLQRVAAAGGPVTVLTRADRTQGELDHLWPELLPGGRAVLFTITAQTGGLDAAQVAVLDLQTGTRKILVRGGTHAHYVPNGLGSPTRAEREGGLASPTQGEVGHLVYVAAGTLRAVAFDLARLEPRGTSLPVVPDVVTTNTGDVYAVVAGDGTLAYVSGPAAWREPVRYARSSGWTARATSRRSRRPRVRTSFPGCHPMARASRYSQTIRNATSGCGTWAARRSPL